MIHDYKLYEMGNDYWYMPKYAETPEEAVSNFLPDGADDMDTYTIVVEDNAGAKRYFLCVFYDRGSYGEWDIVETSLEEINQNLPLS